MKQYWQMRLQEYLSSNVSLEFCNKDRHRQLVQDAIWGRKPVPAEVLADHPSIATVRRLD